MEFATGTKIEVLIGNEWIGPFTVTEKAGRTSDHLVLAGDSGEFEHYADEFNTRLIPTKPIRLTGEFTELFPKEFGPAEPVAEPQPASINLAGFTNCPFTLVNRNGVPYLYSALEGMVINHSRNLTLPTEELRLIWVRFQLTHLWAMALQTARIYRANGALEKAGRFDDLADSIQYELEISRDMDGI